MRNDDRTPKPPYKECETCKTIADCPHPDVAMDGLGSPLSPDCCLRPIEVMKETLKKKKNGRSSSLLG